MDINVNTASREALVALPGIGETLADLIIQARPFSTIEELVSIPGIGPHTLERLKEQGLVVGDLSQKRRLIAIPGFTAETSLFPASQHYEAMRRYGWYPFSQRRKKWDL